MAFRQKAPKFRDFFSLEKGQISPKISRNTGLGQKHTQIIRRFTRVKFTRFRCISAIFLFSCCGSVAAPRQEPGQTIKYLQKRTSGAAGISLSAPG
jgi:hypothetical protein